jgi:hypothetical protein
MSKVDLHFFRQIAIVLIAVALLLVFGAVLLTPSFATAHFSPDHHITPSGISKLHTFRILLILCGGAILVLSALLFKAPDQKTVFMKLNSFLQSEKMLVGLILLIGTVIRLFHIPFVGVGSPYSLGGLFLEFARQIIAQGYHLPVTIPLYTEGGIPFAYPPLPFYIEAVLLDFFSLPQVLVVNLLPPLVTVMTLPAFYFLTSQAVSDYRTRLFCLALFAVLPNAFLQQIEGQGLAEAFGTLSLIWYFVFLFKASQKRSTTNFLLVGFFWAICVISSPGSAYVSLPIFLVFSIYMLVSAGHRNRSKIIMRLLLSAVTAVALSSPYWLSVIANHGIDVFVDSFAAQHKGLWATIAEPLLSLSKLQIVSGPYPLMWNLLTLSGIIWMIIRSRWVLLAWFFILYAIPNEGPWMASIAIAILAGVGISKVIIPALASSAGKCRNEEIAFTCLSVGLLVIILLLFANTLTVVTEKPFIPKWVLSTHALEAMNWVRENTSANTQLIVLAFHQVQEWSPQISRRTVLNMQYGAEWQPDERENILRFEAATSTCREFDCVLLLVQETFHKDQVVLFAEKQRLSNLMDSVQSQAEFDLWWENDEISIGLLHPRSTPQSQQ